MNILVVADDTEFIEAAANGLETDNHLFQFENPEDALEFITSSEVWGIVEIDVIFVQYKMPQFDGYELTRKIRELDLYKGTLIVFCTSFYTIENFDSALVSGANIVLIKPYFLSSIEVVLEAALFRRFTKKLSGNK